MNMPQILLVDDDPSLLEALPHMIALRMQGVNIDTANSAQRALELIDEREYDTIISDIKMPGMDGLELLDRIHEVLPDTPTLLITGHGDQTLVTQALRGGAYDFVQKPIDRVYFVAALQRAIHTRQMRRLIQEQHQALEQYAQSLEQLVEQRTREFLAASEAMEVLVRDALDLSLLESHNFSLHCSLCDLVEVCQQVLHAYTMETGHALDFEVTRESVVVEIDRDRISQVLINLIFNVRKASLRTSLQASPIQVMLQQTSNEASVTIREMKTEEFSEHPLEQFYRRSHANVQAQINFDEGIGLLLSQQIVAKHGGQIKIQSSPEMGSSFCMNLPLATRVSGETIAPFEPPEWMVS